MASAVGFHSAMRPSAASTTTTASRTCSNNRPMPRSAGARTRAEFSSAVICRPGSLVVYWPTPLSQELILQRKGDGSGAGFGTELAQDAAHVEIGCCTRDDKVMGDLRVRQPADHQT